MTAQSWTRYIVEVYSPNTLFLSFYVKTIREARELTNEYGEFADKLTVRDRRGYTVAIFIRDKSGAGNRWFRVAHHKGD